MNEKIIKNMLFDIKKHLHEMQGCVLELEGQFNSPSQQTSVDTRDGVHVKKPSDTGANPVSDTNKEKSWWASKDYSKEKSKSELTTNELNKKEFDKDYE